MLITAVISCEMRSVFDLCVLLHTCVCLPTKVCVPLCDGEHTASIRACLFPKKEAAMHKFLQDNTFTFTFQAGFCQTDHKHKC